MRRGNRGRSTERMSRLRWVPSAGFGVNRNQPFHLFAENNAHAAVNETSRGEQSQ